MIDKLNDFLKTELKVIIKDFIVDIITKYETKQKYDSKSIFDLYAMKSNIIEFDSEELKFIKKLESKSEVYLSYAIKHELRDSIPALITEIVTEDERINDFFKNIQNNIYVRLTSND